MKYRDYSPHGYTYHYDVPQLFGKHYRVPNTRTRVSKTLEECIALVRSLGIKSIKQYRAAHQAGQLDGCPLAATIVYQVKWSFIFGIRSRGSGWPPLSKLKQRVSALGITDKPGYVSAWRAGKLEGFPLTPPQSYGVRWAEVFGKRAFGSGWPPLSQLKEAIKRLGIKTEDQYKEAWKAGKLDGFPAYPPQGYKVRWTLIVGKKPKGRRAESGV